MLNDMLSLGVALWAIKVCINRLYYYYVVDFSLNRYMYIYIYIKGGRQGQL